MRLRSTTAGSDPKAPHQNKERGLRLLQQVGGFEMQR